MSGIGDIITGSDLASIQRWNERTFNQKGYIAPTVFRLASSKKTSYPYFKTLDECLQFINHLVNGGSKLPTTAGSVQFSAPGTAQTLGINVDFYWPVPVYGIVNVPYSFVKQKYAGPLIMPFKFYKTNGSGPYYSVLLNSELGIAATIVNKISPEKIQHLDKLTREVTLLRANYNALAGFLSDLSKKKLNKTQQQVFNEGIIRLQEYKDAIRQIKDIDFVFGKSGQISGIGILPVIAWLIIAAVSAVLATYTITKLAARWAEVAKVRSDNDAIEFITDANIKIAKDPTLTLEQKRELIAKNNSIIDKIEQHKDTVEANAAKPDMIEQITGLAKWAFIFYGVKIVAEAVGKPKN